MMISWDKKTRIESNPNKVQSAASTRIIITHLSHKPQLGIKLLTLAHIRTIHRQKHHRIGPNPNNPPHRQPTRTHHIDPPVRIHHIASILDQLRYPIHGHTQLEIGNGISGRGFVVEFSRGAFVEWGGGGGGGIVADVEGGVSSVLGEGGDGEGELRGDGEGFGTKAKPLFFC